jgi:nucleoside-diphosphate-sugar epimerase
MLRTALTGRRTLVTGATGFIGSALRQRLLDMGAEVHGVARTARANSYSSQMRWWAADLADEEAAIRVLSDVRPDVVFHLASHVSGDRSYAAVSPTVRNNLLTTTNLLTAACESGHPRVVLAGSMEECAPGDPNPVPGSPYAAAKTAAAAYGRMFHALYALPVVHLRVFMVYGPGPQDIDKLVPYVTCSLLRGKPPLLSSGMREIDWVYIDDVVDAFVAAADAPDAVGSTIDVGSGGLLTIRAIVEELARLVGGEAEPQFGALADRPLERRRTADLAPARELLGWTPTTSVPTGLSRTVAWFRDHVDDTEA